MGVTQIVTALIVLSSSCYCFDNKSILQYLNDAGYTLFVRLVTEAHLDTILDGSSNISLSARGYLFLLVHVNPQTHRISQENYDKAAGVHHLSIWGKRRDPYTVFAPTNVAIAKVDPDLMVALSHNDLLLKNLIRYHILRGFTLIPEFQSGQSETTLNGQAITVDKMNNTIVLNNVSSITSNSDVVLKNGVVHPIDAVLVPPIFSTNNLAAELVVRDDKFSEFLFSLLLTNMTALIERGEYTIFAPTDAAFTGDIGSIFYRDMPNAPHFYLEMLRCHIVPGARASSQLKTGDVLYTLHGSPLTVKVNSQGVFIDDAKVVVADIGASNGVIHGIDSLLFTDDLRRELETLQQQS